MSKAKTKLKAALRREKILAANRKRYDADREARRARSREYGRANRAELNRKQIEKRKERLAKGLCSTCALPALPNLTVCMKHWITRILVSNIGLAHLENVIYLFKKFKAQGARCAYTGIKLVPGKNASVDHTASIFDAPHRAADITNLQWVTKRINASKHNLSHRPFIQMCRDVVAHEDSTDKAPSKDYFLPYAGIDVNTWERNRREGKSRVNKPGIIRKHRKGSEVPIPGRIREQQAKGGGRSNSGRVGKIRSSRAKLLATGEANWGQRNRSHNG
jgi:hypothetical protein